LIINIIINKPAWKLTNKADKIEVPRIIVNLFEINLFTKKVLDIVK